MSVAISPSSISFLITSGAPELERLGDLLDGGARVDLDGRVLALLASSRACAWASRSGSTHCGRRRRPRPRRGGWDCGGGGVRSRRAACESITTRRRRPPPPPSPRLAATTTGRARAAAAATAGSAVGTGAA